MLSPRFLRCKQIVQVPFTFTRADGTVVPRVTAARTVRCARTRWHRGLKCTFRFDDPGPPLRSGREVARLVALWLFLVYLAVVVILYETGIYPK